ncbi:hypothetical protein [Haliangium sp.]|uniref:hypothetical protein n=1 Tax=Haliangium sp. TaxID=2663208 RepID=UPI003D108128
MSAFDISTKTRGEIALDNDGKARVELLVTNRMGRTVHAHVRLEPSSDNAQAADTAWLRLDHSDLEFDADETSTLRVDVDLPDDTAVGLYAFRVFVGADTDNPDSDFARSEPIAVRYAGKKESPGKVPWMWLALAGGLLVIAAGGGLLYWWLTRTPECTVERSHYDDDKGECVCPDNASETTVDGVQRCVCDTGYEYDATSETCSKASCPAKFAVFDESKGGCECPDGTRKATLPGGGEKCVCDDVTKSYDPRSKTCRPPGCKRTHAVWNDLAGACECPPGTHEKTVNNRPVCACPDGANYDPNTKRCVAIADLAIVDVRLTGRATPLPISTKYRVDIRVMNRGGSISGKYHLAARQKIDGTSKLVQTWENLPPLQPGASAVHNFTFTAPLQFRELYVYIKPLGEDADSGNNEFTTPRR